MREAAIFYLQYCGQKATEKQIAKLIKTVGPAVIRMALQRGYTPKEQL